MWFGGIINIFLDIFFVIVNFDLSVVFVLVLILFMIILYNVFIFGLLNWDVMVLNIGILFICLFYRLWFCWYCFCMLCNVFSVLCLLNLFRVIILVKLSMFIFLSCVVVLYFGVIMYSEILEWFRIFVLDWLILEVLRMIKLYLVVFRIWIVLYMCLESVRLDWWVVRDCM